MYRIKMYIRVQCSPQFQTSTYVLEYILCGQKALVMVFCSVFLSMKKARPLMSGNIDHFYSLTWLLKFNVNFCHWITKPALSFSEENFKSKSYGGKLNRNLNNLVSLRCLLWKGAGYSFKEAILVSLIITGKDTVLPCILKRFFHFRIYF